jgi:cation diffusion facilitator family transporter
VFYFCDSLKRGGILSEQYSGVRRVLWGVLCLNWVIAFAKMVVGYLIGSISMVADGIHSLSDGVSNIIGLIAIALAGKPPDHDHPYGHQKFETFAALAIAGLLFTASLNIIGEGIQRIFHPNIPQVSWESIGIMVITIMINVGVMYYEFVRGKVLMSDILIADAMHTRSDIFVSAAVLVTLCGIKYGLPWIDPLASLVIAVFIAWAGWDIIKHCAAVLCDGVGLNPDEIRQVVLQVEGVWDCHQIRSRGRADFLFLDLHVLVSNECTLQQAHQISHRVEAAIKKAFGVVGDVVVHVEPFTDAEICKRKWKQQNTAAN